MEFKIGDILAYNELCPTYPYTIKTKKVIRHIINDIPHRLRHYFRTNAYMLDVLTLFSMISEDVQFNIICVSDHKFISVLVNVKFNRSVSLQITIYFSGNRLLYSYSYHYIWHLYDNTYDNGRPHKYIIKNLHHNTGINLLDKLDRVNMIGTIKEYLNNYDLWHTFYAENINLVMRKSQSLFLIDFVDCTFYIPFNCDTTRCYKPYKFTDMDSTDKIYTILSRFNVVKSSLPTHVHGSRTKKAIHSVHLCPLEQL